MNKSNNKLSNLSSTGLEHTPSYAFALLSPPSTTWSAFDTDDVGVNDVDDDASLKYLLSFFGIRAPTCACQVLYTQVDCNNNACTILLGLSVRFHPFLCQSTLNLVSFIEWVEHCIAIGLYTHIHQLKGSSKPFKRCPTMTQPYTQILT